MPSDLPIDLDALASLIATRLRTEADRLIDRPELARRLNVGERTVGAMVARQELPPPLLHTSGIARWDWSEVLKYLQGRRERKVRKGRGRYDRRTLEASCGQGGRP